MSNLPQVPEISVTTRVYYFDTDSAGVAHNISYLRWVEVARSELAEKLGWSLQDMGQVCPVVARTEIDYLKPARLGENLTVRAYLEKMEKVRFYIAFEITRDAILLSRARQTMVSVDLATGRPRPLREDWLKFWSHLVA